MFMKKVAVVGCGAYMESGYGCPGEWRRLKAAAMGEGSFEEPSSVVSFVSCECPGRSVIPTLGMAAKLSEIKPDVIHFSTCMASAKPECPYFKPEELAKMVEAKTGIKVILGTHDYH
jgi:predicted metal-binding protein